MDVSKVNPEQAFQRFKNVRGKEFRPESLNAYFRRFKRALYLFLQYADNPEGWKYKGQSATARKSKLPKSRKTHDNGAVAAESVSSPQSVNSVPTMDYPFPLREGCVVRLRLPTDLRTSEVERLTSFMRTLVVES